MSPRTDTAGDQPARTRPLLRGAVARHRHRHGPVVVALALLLAACRSVGGPVAPPSPSAAPTSPATSSPSSPSGTGTAPGPGSTATPTSTPTPGPTSGSTMSPTPAPTTVPTTVPADFRFPPFPDGAEGAAGSLPDVGVCGAALPGVAAATDSRFVERSGPEFRDSLGVLVFADAAAAVGFVSGVRREARSCPPAAVPGAGRSVVPGPLAGAWGEGLALLLVDTSSEAGAPSIGSHLLLARRGNAVAVRYAAAEYLLDPPFALDPAQVALLRAELDALAPALCRWTAAGCATPSPAPSPTGGPGTVPAGLHPLVPGHNDIGAPRINLVFAAHQAPGGADWQGYARQLLTWDGPVPIDTGGDPVTAGETPYDLTWGPFAVEPLRSHKDLFNVWWSDVPAPTIFGWDGPGDAFPGDLPRRVVVTLTWTDLGAKRATAALPYFYPPVPPPARAELGSRVVIDVSDRPLDAAADDSLLTHELGHALFALPDAYVYDEQGFTGPEVRSAYPMCAADQAQAEQWWGDLAGVVDPFADEYEAAYARSGIPLDPTVAAIRRDDIRVGYVDGGCFGPAGTARRSSPRSLMYTETTDLFDAVERRWAEQVLDAWAGR